MKNYIIKNYKAFCDYVDKNASDLIRDAGNIISSIYVTYLRNGGDSSLILGNISSENSCLEEITSKCEPVDMKKKIPAKKKTAPKHRSSKQVGIEIGDTNKTFIISYEKETAPKHRSSKQVGIEIGDTNKTFIISYE